VLLTTQYLEEADRLADRIAVIDHGRVIAEGTPASLKSDLGGTVVAVTMADPAVAARAAGMLATWFATQPTTSGSTVELAVDDSATVVEVVRILDNAGLPVSALAVREPSLDDVFLSLTGHRAEPVEAEPVPAARGAA
jgi:ABC-type multidrug transport system ATPase subunit